METRRGSLKDSGHSVSQRSWWKGTRVLAAAVKVEGTMLHGAGAADAKVGDGHDIGQAAGPSGMSRTGKLHVSRRRTSCLGSVLRSPHGILSALETLSQGP